MKRKTRWVSPELYSTFRAIARRRQLEQQRTEYGAAPVRKGVDDVPPGPYLRSEKRPLAA